jgi:prefoldin subunit 5
MMAGLHEYAFPEYTNPGQEEYAEIVRGYEMLSKNQAVLSKNLAALAEQQQELKNLIFAMTADGRKPYMLITSGSEAAEYGILRTILGIRPEEKKIGDDIANIWYKEPVRGLLTGTHPDATEAIPGIGVHYPARPLDTISCLYSAKALARFVEDLCDSLKEPEIEIPETKIGDVLARVAAAKYAAETAPAGEMTESMANEIREIKERQRVIEERLKKLDDDMKKLGVHMEVIDGYASTVFKKLHGG